VIPANARCCRATCHINDVRAEQSQRRRERRQKTQEVRKDSEKFLDTAYDGLGDGNLAKMVIALRTPDYGELIPQMLTNLDDANRANPHYLGWARHSYNDYLDAAN
jgi:hypothetical protein